MNPNVIEELGGEEAKRIKHEALVALAPAINLRDWKSEFLVCSTHTIISNFRTKALKSYDEKKILEGINPGMRPFLMRDAAMTRGKELQYHASRIGYVRALVKEVRHDPLVLRNLERGLVSLLNRNLVGSTCSDSDRSLFWLQFQQLEAAIGDIYALYSSEIFGDEKYLLGIDDSGHLHAKAVRTLGGKDMREFYQTLHAHVPSLMCLENTGALERIVPNHASWASDKDRLKELVNEKMPGALGLDMLKVGVDNKHFFSSLPYEVIINGRGISRMTVIDVPPKTVYFCTRFSDDTISVGALSTPDENGMILFQVSDLGARVVLEDYLSTYDSRSLLDLAGCIARDMFVCEERTKFYQESRVATTGKTRKKKKLNMDRIIWLPRFRMNLEGALSDERHVREQVIRLSPCHVSGHPRKCKNPSEKQLELARSLGYILDPGCTYVKEHNRKGSVEFTRNYKSRSAVDLVFGAERGKYLDKGLRGEGLV